MRSLYGPCPNRWRMPRRSPAPSSPTSATNRMSALVRMPAASMARMPGEQHGQAAGVVADAGGEQAVALPPHPHVGAGGEHRVQMRRDRHQRIAAAAGAAANAGDVAFLVRRDVLEAVRLGHRAPQQGALGFLERRGRGFSEGDDVGDGAVVLGGERVGRGAEGGAADDALNRRRCVLRHDRSPVTEQDLATSPRQTRRDYFAAGAGCSRRSFSVSGALMPSHGQIEQTPLGHRLAGTGRRDDTVLMLTDVYNSEADGRREGQDTGAPAGLAALPGMQMVEATRERLVATFVVEERALQRHRLRAWRRADDVRRHVGGAGGDPQSSAWPADHHAGEQDQLPRGGGARARH